MLSLQYWIAFCSHLLHSVTKLSSKPLDFEMDSLSDKLALARTTMVLLDDFTPVLKTSTKNMVANISRCLLCPVWFMAYIQPA